MERGLVIAIDGPAAGGKGTVARRLAQRLGYRFVDTGAMYRAVAWAALRKGLSLDDGEALGELATHLEMDFQERVTPEGVFYRLLVNGQDVTEAIRQPEVERASSVVAQYPQVRRVLVAKQRQLARQGGVVMEGRDITTVVLPDADLKLYITASLTERAQRRYAQYQEQGYMTPGPPHEHLATLQAQLMLRDQRDAQRATSPLRIAQDAIVLDTTCLSVEESVEVIWRLLRTRFPHALPRSTPDAQNVHVQPTLEESSPGEVKSSSLGGIGRG